MRLKQKGAYIIAEAGVNHNGRYDLAVALIDAASSAGVDAIKFQTYNAKKLVSKNLPKLEYQKTTSISEVSQLDMLQKLELPYEWHHKLQEYASKKKIDFLSTAFDFESLDFLIDLDPPFFKISSGEIINGPLLWRFAKSGKPLLLSTGMATVSEIETALAIILHSLSVKNEPRNMGEVWAQWSDPLAREKLCGVVALLQCTSLYPADLNHANLAVIPKLRELFGLEVGYSDHTLGPVACLGAIALGSSIIEKHLTLDSTMVGPDHKASMEPEDFTKMVEQIRELETAIGDGYKRPLLKELLARDLVRQKIVASRGISAGAIICRDDLTTARVGCGLEPNELWGLVGSPALKTMKPGEGF